MRLLAITLCLTACAGDVSQSGDDDDQQPPDDVSKTAVFLTPPQHLTRISLALRGIRPSLEDLQAVEANPDAIPGIVDGYLATPAFAETVKELHNETLLMRIEVPQFTYPAIGPLAGKTARQMNTGKFDEPLELIRYIVMTDRPYTEIVTANYTMTNDVTAAMWGMTHTGAPEAWTKSALPDARAPLGILSSNAIYDRYRSAGFNFNRGRANFISRALLCHDYLTSDIVIDTTVDLADPDVVANAVVQNSTCAGCHHTLDPLASYLFTFRNTLAPVSVDAYPVTYYSPATANRWMTANKRPPMFFGQSTTNMTGLGSAIANDPRFAKCAATRFASYFTEVAQNQISGAWVARLQKALVDSGYNAKALAKAVVLSDEFRISHDTDAAQAEDTVGTLKLRPEQLHRMIRDLTGFSWSTTAGNLRGMPYGTANLLESDFIGFRVLAGGIDSYFVTDYVHTMNATSSLVAKSAAAAAADFVVEHDLAAAAADRTLFVEAAVAETSETAIRAQLAYLHGRIYGELVAPDSPEVDETFSLYTDAVAAAAGNRARAWKLTLIGMLSNFRALFY